MAKFVTLRIKCNASKTFNETVVCTMFYTARASMSADNWLSKNLHSHLLTKLRFNYIKADTQALTTDYIGGTEAEI